MGWERQECYRWKSARLTRKQTRIKMKIAGKKGKEEERGECRSKIWMHRSVTCWESSQSSESPIKEKAQDWKWGRKEKVTTQKHNRSVGRDVGVIKASKSKIKYNTSDSCFLYRGLRTALTRITKLSNKSCSSCACFSSNSSTSYQCVYLRKIFLFHSGFSNSRGLTSRLAP